MDKEYDHQKDNKWPPPLGCVTRTVGIDLLVMKAAIEHRSLQNHIEAGSHASAGAGGPSIAPGVSCQRARGVGRSSSIQLLNETYFSGLQPHFIWHTYIPLACPVLIETWNQTRFLWSISAIILKTNNNNTKIALKERKKERGMHSSTLSYSEQESLGLGRTKSWDLWSKEELNTWGWGVGRKPGQAFHHTGHSQRSEVLFPNREMCWIGWSRSLYH